MLGLEREKHDENRKSYIITPIFEREPRLELWMAMSEEETIFIILHFQKENFYNHQQRPVCLSRVSTIKTGLYNTLNHFTCSPSFSGV